jgi:hypothetical protein
VCAPQPQHRFPDRSPHRFLGQKRFPYRFPYRGPYCFPYRNLLAAAVEVGGVRMESKGDRDPLEKCDLQFLRAKTRHESDEKPGAATQTVSGARLSLGAPEPAPPDSK